MSKSLGLFVSHTRNGATCTTRGDEIEIDGVVLDDQARAALLADFEAWEPPIPVPAAVTAAQAKIALDAAGLYDQVRTICLNHPVRAVQIYWTSATVWERGNAYVQAIGAELDLDDDEIDDLFRAAAALT